MSPRPIDSRRRARGQSLIEFAIAAPVLVLLLLGAMDLTSLAADYETAQTASRAGARLASILGGQECVSSPLTQTQVDDEIYSDVKAATQKMVYSTLTDVYIYAPAAANGVFNSGTDPYTHYNSSGARDFTNFPLSSRHQSPLGSETSIGVLVDWSFKPPTGVGSPALNLSSYAVFKAEAVSNPPPTC